MGHIKSFVYYMSLCIAILLLAACQRPPKTMAPSVYTVESVAQLTHFRVSGKVGFRQGDTGGQASFVWQQSGRDFTLQLFNPFGSEEAYLAYRGGIYHFKMPNKAEETTQNIEPLFRESLGWSAPIAHLSYWIRGLPLPNTPKQMSQTSDGARVLQQSQWTITYLQMTQVNQLSVPKSMLLTRSDLSEGAVRLKMILHWD